MHHCRKPCPQKTMLRSCPAALQHPRLRRPAEPPRRALTDRGLCQAVRSGVGFSLVQSCALQAVSVSSPFGVSACKNHSSLVLLTHAATCWGCAVILQLFGTRCHFSSFLQPPTATHSILHAPKSTSIYQAFEHPYAAQSKPQSRPANSGITQNRLVTFLQATKENGGWILPRCTGLVRHTLRGL